jgi:hypothetical protein
MGCFPYSCIFLSPFSFGALAAGGSLFGNNNAAAKPLFGQTAGTSWRAPKTFGTPGQSYFGATGFGGAQMGGMGGAISSLFPESTKAILDSHGFWIYKCDQCNFETKYSGNIKEHFKTEKHLRNTKGN